MSRDNFNRTFSLVSILSLTLYFCIQFDLNHYMYLFFKESNVFCILSSPQINDRHSRFVVDAIWEAARKLEH